MLTSDSESFHAESSKVSNLISYDTDESGASSMNPPKPSTESDNFRFPFKSVRAFLSTSTGLITKSDEATLSALEINDFNRLALPLNPGSDSC